MRTRKFAIIYKAITELISFLEGKLPEENIIDFKEFLEHDEFGVAFEGICDQIYEFDVKIDRQFFSIAIELATVMEMSKERWAFIEELVE